MLITDKELLDNLRSKYGTASVGEIRNLADGRRFVYIDALPVPYEKAYDDVVGPGAYSQAAASEEAQADSGPELLE